MLQLVRAEDIGVLKGWIVLVGEEPKVSYKRHDTSSIKEVLKL